MSKPYLSVIVPAYNEEKRIDSCLEGLTAYLWNYTYFKFEIIIVDNGSTDNTLEVACRWKEHWPQLRILSIPERGKGAAIREGMLAAHGHFRYMADVDLSTPACEIARFLHWIYGLGNDIVIGSRTMAKMTPARWMFHKGFQMTTRMLLPGIRDTQCGFKMFSDRAAMEIFPNVKTTGLAFDVEVLHLARLKGFKIIEIPVPWIENSGSVIRPVRDGISMLGDLIRIMARRDHIPMAVRAETRQL